MTLTVIFENIKEVKEFASLVSAAETGKTPPPVIPPVQPAPPAQQYHTQAQPPVQQAPTQKTTYTLDDLARAAATLMDSGRQGELIQLLGQFGAEALTMLPPEQYGAFATALRGLGAQI